MNDREQNLRKNRLQREYSPACSVCGFTALDLRENETGLHTKQVAAHTLALARQFYDSTDDLREIYWGSRFTISGRSVCPMPFC